MGKETEIRGENPEPRLITYPERITNFYRILDSVSDRMHPLAYGLLFAGDRISVCDEAVVGRIGEDVVGFATIAPRGEANSGQPTIVGLYVLPDHRRRRYGAGIFVATVERCLDRGFEKVRVDVMSDYVAKIINNLPDELKEHLDVCDLGNLMEDL